MAQAQLDNIRDFSHFRRIMLSGDLPTSAGGPTIPQDNSSDTCDLGSVLAMGYHYNDAGSFGTSGTDQYIKTALANTHFIHAAFENTATSGTTRGMYMITALKGATGTTGECIRARTFVFGTTASGSDTHGAHIELRLNGTTTSGTGAINSASGGAAIRATLSADAGCTVTSGTMAALRLDGNFGLTSTSANASFIWCSDINATNKMPIFLNVDSLATGIVNSGSTLGGTIKGLTCKIAGTTYYLPLYATFS